MALKEWQKGRQWGIDATGEDISKLKGMLTPYANEKYREAFHKNEGIGFEKLSDPRGNETWLRKDGVPEALENGYGRVSLSPRMTMPAVPWAQKKVSPGRHRFRYDKTTGSMVEV